MIFRIAPSRFARTAASALAFGRGSAEAAVSVSAAALERMVAGA